MKNLHSEQNPGPSAMPNSFSARTHLLCSFLPLLFFLPHGLTWPLELGMRTSTLWRVPLRWRCGLPRFGVAPSTWGCGFPPLVCPIQLKMRRFAVFPTSKWSKGRFPLRNLSASMVPKPKLVCAQTKTATHAVTVKPWEYAPRKAFAAQRRDDFFFLAPTLSVGKRIMIEGLCECAPSKRFEALANL